MKEENKIEIYFEELRASNKLPSPAGVALEIIRLTQDPDYQLEDILRPVQSDPILAGRLLKLANAVQNSAFIPVLSIKEAVQRVGTKALTHLALSLSILDSNRTGACPAFDYDGFWQVSLLKALAMQLLAEANPSLKPEEAFSVGLLTEIGRLALAQIHPTRYAQCLLTNDRNLLELEREAFLITHEQITLQMMSEWGTPAWVLSAVKLSQQSFTNSIEADENIMTLAAQLRLASLLAGGKGLNHGLDDLPLLLQSLSLSYSALDQIRSRLFTEWRIWGELLIMPVQENFESWLTDYRMHFERDAESDLTILVVEDDRLERHILCTYLTNQGYKVFEAENGNQALNEYILHRPHIVITDYLMQPMDGITLIKALRSNQDAQRVYVILITADNHAEVMSTAFDAGVNDFIIKPAKSEELNARIIGAKRFFRLQQEELAEREIIKNEAVDFALAKRRFATLAITDPLTGLFNRRYATSRLEQEWASYVRHKGVFAVLSLDLDLFKQINDNFGHDAGDRVLQHFSCLIQQSIRSEDIACRMGGEEFVVICPNIDPNMIDTLCERIRNRVEKQQPLELKLSRLVTVSIGAAVSEMSTDSNSSDTLKRSDKALYLAKTAGRNKFVVDRPADG